MVIGEAASSAGSELERVDPVAAQRAQASLGKLFAYVMELYTAGASSSVSAAEADGLMRSVLYVMGVDAAAGMSAHAVAVLDVDDILAAWHAALARLDEHVARTMELHARVVATLSQLENLALWDTLASIRTLPRRYDTRFAAHEVAAEIDYQLQVPVSEELLGIDYVDAWLAQLLAEAQQLAAMDIDTVRASLSRADPEWKYSVANLLDLLQVGQG